jgi:hypothetical protein
MADRYLLRVTTSRACFGLFVDGDRITGGAPYGMAALRRAGIVSAAEAVRFWKRKGARVQKLRYGPLAEVS